jgi:hypothetical protein
MKASILSSGSLVWTLLSANLVHSFPTAENFAKLAGRNQNHDHPLEGLYEGLVHLREKRLLFDPMTKPIDSMSRT